MSVKFEKNATNEGLLTFEIPLEDVKKGLDKTFKKVQKTVSVPGFRKGKVPRQIFNNVYGEEALYEDTLNLLLQDAFKNAIEESGVQPVIEPQIHIEKMEKGTQERCFYSGNTGCHLVFA